MVTSQIRFFFPKFDRTNKCAGTAGYPMLHGLVKDAPRPIHTEVYIIIYNRRLTYSIDIACRNSSIIAKEFFFAAIGRSGIMTIVNRIPMVSDCLH